MSHLAQPSLRRLILAMVTAAAANAAQAAVEPLVMQMSATSSSCITHCTGTANDTIDTDTPEPLYGSFGTLAVSTFTPDGTNSFWTEAAGSTTLTGATTFTVYQYVNRPTRPAGSTGDYIAMVETNFAFITGAEGGQLSVEYVVNYARPIAGKWLHTGLGINSPRNLGGFSPEALYYDSLSGAAIGAWLVPLLPNTYYDFTLSTGASTSFVAAPDKQFDQDMLDARYKVTMPSFAQSVPVPEPSSWMLWASGLAGLIYLGRRGRHSHQA